jgi:peptidoglycan/xylan/chitin deacetylase (PgdA/CDA1 family)
MQPVLHVVMYHYVRDLPNTPFPKIKGMHTSDFSAQVAALKGKYEMATLESALAFLQGTYQPPRDLCLLTFDDGLREHYTDITPVLIDARIQGLFFVITSCLENRHVASVHKNHFLMAALDFDDYRQLFLNKLADVTPNSPALGELDKTLVQRTYRWDTPEVASFKYLFNFIIDRTVRDKVLKDIFQEIISDEDSFSQSLYFNWQEAQDMQSAGMLIGGHSHEHNSLASLSDDDVELDLRTCQRLLSENLLAQSIWPFSYPYGKKDSFSEAAIRQLKRFGFVCSFSTEVGVNSSQTDRFNLRRLDCKDVQVH